MTDTAAAIRARLAALDPVLVELRDDSALHAGHEGARGGGHYRLVVVSPRFAGEPTLARHRLVYDALGPLMHRHIHALALTALAPGEAAPPRRPTTSPRKDRA